MINAEIQKRNLAKFTTMNKTRLEAFSDGVIAIIITIMVLEMKIPHETSWEALINMTPTFFSYMLSFIYIGIYWGNHHHLLHVVKKVSSGIIWSNLNLLFWLSLIPFATGWMGENHFAAIPIAVYAGLLLACGIAYTILQKTIMSGHEFSPKMKEALKKLGRKEMVSTVLYILSVPFAFINPIISGLLFVTVAVIWLIPDKNIERAYSSE
jgi:uncharacterized membrane protein